MGIFTRETPLPVTGGGLRRASSQPFGAQRPIVASARLIDKKKISNTAKQGLKPREWQAAAWDGYDMIGEIHFGFNHLADTFSRIRVHGAVITDPSEAPQPLSVAGSDVLNTEVKRKAEDLMRELTEADFSSMARAFALNISVAGECLLIQIPEDGPAAEETGEGKGGVWVIRSTDEVVVTADAITLKPEKKGADQTILAKKKGGEWTPDVAIGRIWRKHPRHSDDPDSSMRAVAEPIDELLLLSKLIRTTTRARLNAGILFVPDGISSMGGTSAEPIINADGTIEEEAIEDDGGFITELMDAMTAPITDEDAVSSVVPSVLTGSGELGEKIKHITMERKTDEWLSSRSDRALERIMQGIDIPKDIVTGLSNVKYANAVVIDQNFWKSSVEPLALLLVDALTDIYLRPLLIANGVTEEDAARVCVWYDPSEIVTSADQGDEATSGYDKMLLGGAAWRRVHGFSEEDAPSEQEMALQLLATKGTLPEDVTSALLRLLLPKIIGEATEVAAEGRVPDSARDLLSGDAPTTDNEPAQTEGA